MNIREAHALFLDKNPEVAVGKTKFHDLHPQHVLSSEKKNTKKYVSAFIIGIYR